jgi:hypothetical protein
VAVVATKGVLPTTASSSPEAGLKAGDPSAPTPLRVTSLRFAVVNAGGQLSPGAAGMRVKAGSPIVFAIEAEGIDPAARNGTALLDLRYTLRGTDAKARSLVSDYRLKSGREILTGEQGYLAFTPPAPGTYQFVITARRAAFAEAEGGRDEASVEIDVEAP